MADDAIPSYATQESGLECRETERLDDDTVLIDKRVWNVAE